MKSLTPLNALLEHRRARLAGIAGGLAMARALTPGTTTSPSTSDPPDLPEFVLDRLADLALLQGVPFDYLVPDARLLPPESIRFFTLSADWLAALHDGVLSVGESSSAEAALRRATAVPALGARLAASRARRRGQAAAAPVDAAATSNVTGGVLLRSSLVADYPGLQVRGYDSTDPAAAPLSALRIDRPSPGVLFALFGGPLAALVLDEPHHGIRLGVDSSSGSPLIDLRGPDGALIRDAGGAPVALAVPTRSGAAAGVVDVAQLAQRIGASGQPGVPAAPGSAALALQLLVAPVRQRFERTGP